MRGRLVRWWTLGLMPVLQAQPPDFDGEEPPPQRREQPPPEGHDDFEEVPPPPPGGPAEKATSPPSAPVPAPAGPAEFEEAPPPAPGQSGAPAPQSPEELPPSPPPPQPAAPGEPVEFEEAPSRPPAPEASMEFTEAPGPGPSREAPPPEEFEEAPAPGPPEQPAVPPPEAPPPAVTPGGSEEALPGEPEVFEVKAEEAPPVSLRTAPPAEAEAPETRPAARRRAGMVNGRGLVNARGRANGLINGRGLVNARGRTNGLVNGRGLVNARGATNGLVNGRRRGLVNGAGLVNGRRRRGLVNGGGLINGEGVINGRGLVNGKGLINGRGLTNGRQLVAAETVPSRPRPRKRLMMAALAVAIALLIIIPIFYIVQVEKGIAIDGIFADWSGVSNKYNDGGASPVPSTDNNVDIDMFGASASDTDLSFYLKVAGQVLKGAGNGVDTLTIFIDKDHDGNGYLVNSPGGVIHADLKLEVFGWDGLVKSASYSKFEGANPNDYSGWKSLGAARAAVSGSELEAQVWFRDTGMSRNSEVSILFYLRDSNGEEDYSDFTIGMSTGVLSVRQREPSLGGGGGSLVLDLTAHARTINVTSITVTRFGSGGGGMLQLSGPGGLERTASFAATGSLTGFVLTVERDRTVSVTLYATGMTGVFGMGLASPTAVTASTNGRTVHVSVSGYSTALVNLADGVPGGIIIDGAFEDWEATRGSAGYRSRLDRSDDVQQSGKVGSPGLIDRGGLAYYPNENINLQEVAEYDSGGGSLYFYARVAGKAMAGQPVPATRRGTPGPSGPPSPPKELRLVGSDAFYVLIDDDGNKNTGYPLYTEDGDLLIGARYCAVAIGKNGVVLEVRTFVYDGGWREGGFSATAASGGKRIELSASGIAALVAHRTIIIAEDWTCNADRSDAPLVGAGRSGGEPTLIVNEVDIAKHVIRIGSSNNPLFRIELEALNGEVEVSGIELQRDGTAPDEDISLVRLVQDADGDWEMTAADRELAGTIFINGTANFMLAPPVVVRPGEIVVLIVAIDVREGAGEYGRFGAEIKRVESSGVEADTIIESETRDVVFVKTNGRWQSLTACVINEIKKKSSGYEVEWIEILNKSGNKISDWKISESLGSWSISITLENGECKYYAIGEDLVYWKKDSTYNTIYLYDNNNNLKDSKTLSELTEGAYSMARYRDADENPTDEWYDENEPTPGNKNDLIPEFQDIIYPLAGLIAVIVVIRAAGRGRTGGMRRMKSGAEKTIRARRRTSEL
ncbi:MAG: hypothetical protein QXH42_02125 [Thermoplasmata archaeon]